MLGYLLLLIPVLCLLAGLAALPFAIRYKRHAPAIDRILYVLLPVSGAIAVAVAVRHVLWALFPNWAAARLAVTYALRHGFHIYYPEATGPVIAQNYSPLYFLLYFPATYLSSPTHALLAGTSLSAVYALAPIWWVHYSSSERNDTFWRWAPFTAFALVGLNLFPITYAVFPIRGDAPMLGLLALSTALLYKYRAPGARVLALSAVFAALSVWTKQPAILGAAALAFYLLLAEGWRVCLRYIGWLAAAGIFLAGLFFLIFAPGPLLLNILVYPLSHPWFTYRCFAFSQLNLPCEYATSSGERLSSLLWMSQNYFAEYAVLFVLILVVAGITLLLDQKRIHVREWMTTHRWMAFVLVGAILGPLGVANRIKAGGEDSAFGACLYFVLAGLTLGIRDMARLHHSLVAKLLLAALMIVYLPASLSKLHALPSLAMGLYQNPQQIAYDFLQRHPDQAYFPWNPLPVVMATGMLYHFDYGVAERLWSGLPVPSEHYFAHVPARFEIIAYPPTYGDAQQKAALSFLTDFREAVEIPELPGWTVLRRQSAPPAER